MGPGTNEQSETHLSWRAPVSSEDDANRDDDADRKEDDRKDDETPAGDQRDDRESPPDPQAADAPAAVTFIAKVQDVLYYAIAVVLLLLGIGALARIGIEFFTHDDSFAERVTVGVNGILFVIIVMELLRTVLAHFEDATFQLKPFLIIGIVSTVRHILTVGAELSIAEEHTGDLFQRADIELGVNALVVLVLVLGLVLVRKTE